MDAQARTTAIRQLCAFARTQRSRQFIYKTPQSLQGLQPEHDLRIHTMADPRPHKRSKTGGSSVADAIDQE
jgi:hypothetical protein